MPLQFFSALIMPCFVSQVLNVELPATTIVLCVPHHKFSVGVQSVADMLVVLVQVWTVHWTIVGIHKLVRK